METDDKSLLTYQSQLQDSSAPLQGQVIPKPSRGGRNTELDTMLIDYGMHYLDHWEEEGNQVPTIPGFCLAVGISKATFYNWINDFTQPGKELTGLQSQFLDLACQLEDTQHDKLIQKGLAGSFQPTIAKLILYKHGHSEKGEIEVKGAKNGADSITQDLPATDAANIYLDLIASQNGNNK